MAFSTHAKAAGAMCSYTATNGVPSCANSWLLNDVLRKKWNRPDAYITTDCGAVINTMGAPLNLKTQEEAAAATINGGTDLEMGTQIWNESMVSAVRQGLVTEATVTTAARRGLMQRMTQGDFDSARSNGWSDLDAHEEVNSTAHQKIAYDAALQSMVLLKNANGMLPLAAGKTIAVIGPGALAQGSMVGPYFGDQICYAPFETRDNRTYYCIPTIASQIAALNDAAGGTTTSAAGVDWAGDNASAIPAALALAKAADIVILALGIDHTIEHEGVDVANNSLPALQLSFAAQVAKLAKPTVLVLIGNDGADIGTITPGVDAVVRAFYPATNGNKALAALLFGKANTWGKLPFTMYPAGYDAQLPPMGTRTGTAYAMAHGQGRSYRYYKGTPLYPFGYGLSLTSFTLACSAPVTLQVECTVTNTGAWDGDEVVQVFHAVSDAIRETASVLHPVPIKQLVGFQRVTVAKGAIAGVAFTLDHDAALSLTTADGSRVVYPGEHSLIFSTGVPGVPDVVHTVTVV